MSTNPEFSIQAFQAGDSRAFAYVHNLHSGRLVVRAGLLVGDKEEAEDIVQDSFLKLWLRRADFKALPDIIAFLQVTVRNGCLDYLKHGKVVRNNERDLIQYLSGEGYWQLELPPEEKDRREIEQRALRYHAEEASPGVKFLHENNISAEEAGGLLGIAAYTLRRMARKCIHRVRQKLGLR